MSQEEIDAVKDEGTRGFAVILQQIDDGALHAELSETIRDVCKELQDHCEKTSRDAKGRVVLTMDLAALGNGTVVINAEVTSKTPKMARPPSVFWLTKQHNLSADNPRQQKLPLQAVPPAPKPIDLAPVNAPARTI